MAKMTDADLRNLVCKRRDASVKYLNNQQAKDRKEALQFYRGDNLDTYGDSGAGLSTVVSRDTMEAVESMLPGLMKPFVSGDEIVRFEPRGAEDEEVTKQVTTFVNYKFSNDNDGFRVVHDSIKDGLMYRLGAGKVTTQIIEETFSETYKDLDEAGLLAIDEKDIDGDIILDEETGLFTVTCNHTVKRRVYNVDVMAPEEFLHEERLTCLEDASFLGHLKTESVGDLIAAGLDKNKCKALSSGEVAYDSDEKDERFEGEDWRGTSEDSDDLARKVTVCEAYVRCDYEGKGQLQWRRVWIGGSNSTIIDHEEVEDHPFVAWTPIPVPHKLIGLSVHDLTKEIQMQKTAMLREQFNNLYLTNRPQRQVVEGQVNIEDLLNPAVGGIIRVKSIGAIQTEVVPFVAEQAFGMIEYLDSVRESRTGSTRYNQGMDANSLNKTATGISIIQNASTQRQELIARQYAEGFLKPAFRKMLALITRHAEKEEFIRLRGEWVPMDPRDWKNNYDMSVAVGLGTGNRESMIAQLTNLMQIDAQVIQLQGGADGPIVTLPNIYEKLKRMVEAMGLKGIENYYTDPSAEDQGPQEPEEDPAAAEMAAEVQKAQMQAQVEIQKAQIKAASDLEIAKIKAQSDMEIETMKAQYEQPVIDLGAIQ